MELKPYQLPQGNLAGARVMITGATGFVGGRLAERLSLEHQAVVSSIVRNWTKAVWISRYPVEMIQGSVQDRDSLVEASRGCDLVFHCASGGGSGSELMQTNVQGTQNVIDACGVNGVRRLVYISSVAVHGANPPDGADAEDEYRHVGRPYGDSKIAAEKLVFEAGRTSDLEVVVVRPTFVWGPRSHLFSVRPIREMHAKTFRLVDGGNGDCHAVFIETLVDAIIAAGVSSDAPGRAFLVTDNYDIKWRDFFSGYANLLGVDPNSLRSISSDSQMVRLRGLAYQLLQQKLEKWKTNPAPLWRKVLRRSARILADRLYRMGVMSRWDVEKYARVGALNSQSTVALMGQPHRYSFDEASEITEAWIRDQLGAELGIDP